MSTWIMACFEEREGETQREEREKEREDDDRCEGGAERRGVR